MTTRLYLIPVVRLTDPIYRIPKYLPHRYQTALTGLEGVMWAVEAYLFEDFFILIADTDSTQDGILSGLSDVLAVPALDNTVPNAVVRDAIRNKLEALDIPAQWVVNGMSYRTILRVVRGVFQFKNRFGILIGHQIFRAGLTLDTTVSALSGEVQNTLSTVATSLGLDYSGVTGSTTIRQLLYGAGNQFASQPFTINGGGLTLEI